MARLFGDMFFGALGLALALAPNIGAAQVVRDCDTWEANARNVIGPPEVAIQSFADGDVRVIGLDTIEPACCFSHLMVTYFTVEEPFPACALISASEGLGFSGMLMSELTVRYTSDYGLTLTLPAGRYDGSSSVMSPLEVMLDRATQSITATHY